MYQWTNLKKAGITNESGVEGERRGANKIRGIWREGRKFEGENLWVRNNSTHTHTHTQRKWAERRIMKLKGDRKGNHSRLFNWHVLGMLYPKWANCANACPVLQPQVRQTVLFPRAHKYLVLPSQSGSHVQGAQNLQCHWQALCTCSANCNTDPQQHETTNWVLTHTVVKNNLLWTNYTGTPSEKTSWTPSIAVLQYHGLVWWKQMFFGWGRVGVVGGEGNQILLVYFHDIADAYQAYDHFLQHRGSGLSCKPGCWNLRGSQCSL